jgi:hypothetical protein
MKKDNIIFDFRLKNQDLRKQLDAYEEKNKARQIKKLIKKAKVKVKQKVNVIKENVKQKYEVYILQNNK